MPKSIAPRPSNGVAERATHGARRGRPIDEARNQIPPNRTSSGGLGSARAAGETPNRARSHPTDGSSRSDPTSAWRQSEPA